MDGKRAPHVWMSLKEAGAIRPHEAVEHLTMMSTSTPQQLIEARCRHGL